MSWKVCRGNSEQSLEGRGWEGLSISCVQLIRVVYSSFLLASQKTTVHTPNCCITSRCGRAVRDGRGDKQERDFQGNLRRCTRFSFSMLISNAPSNTQPSYKNQQRGMRQYGIHLLGPIIELNPCNSKMFKR